MDYRVDITFAFGKTRRSEKSPLEGVGGDQSLLSPPNPLFGILRAGSQGGRSQIAQSQCFPFVNCIAPRETLISLILIFFGFLFCIIPNSNAQTEAVTVDPSYHNLSWPAFFKKVEKNHDLTFYVDPIVLENLPQTDISSNMSLESFLKKSLPKEGINFHVDHAGNVFLTKSPDAIISLSPDIYQTIPKEVPKETPPSEPISITYLKTTREHVATSLVIGSKKEGLKKKEAVLSGYLVDNKFNDPIVGGAIYVQKLGIGTVSDTTGFYSLTLPRGEHVLVISNLNNKEEKIKLTLHSSGKYDIVLERDDIELESVLITSERDQTVESTQMGFERLQTKTIKEIPVVLGERDILKVSTLLPGIQTVGEGTSGFNVRGSPADHNLFYIDKVPVYNTAHVFGFFSAFNSDAIKEFSLAKSNIPARLGGRLASIFDIVAVEGDMNSYKLSGGISPITGRLLFQGPIKKEKLSVMVGLRSTYSNWLLGLINDPDFNSSKVYFGDAVSTITYNATSKDKIKLFGYYSRDNISFGDRTKFDNNNSGASLSWMHLFKEKHTLDLSVVYSKLGLGTENNELPIESYQQSNQLEHKEAKASLTLRPNKNHKIEMGVNSILYQIDRGSFMPSNERSLIEPVVLGKEKGLESGIFLSEEWKISPRLTVSAGLRFNAYSYLGPQSVLEYRENGPKGLNTISDTLTFGNNEQISSHTGLDYRIGAKYTFAPNWSIKGSYNKLHQYIFLLSNTIALAPTDKWKLTDYHIDPLVGDQYSIGLYGSPFKDKLVFSVEGYYKKVQNLVEYKDGADLLINEVPEWDVLQGDLTAYGVELMVKKPKGKINGWINYTYSRSLVLVNDAENGEKINFGEEYPANYDKPHAFNLVANYKINRRYSVSSNVVYSTGRPITYPTSIYSQNNLQLINFTSRNAYRIPDYFRADISVKMEGNLKSKKLLHGSWIFSVYNLTGRKNAYNVYFQSFGGKVRGYKVSIFAQPIISLTYDFKLGNYEN